MTVKNLQQQNQTPELEELRANIDRRKLLSALFAVIGLLSILAGLIVILALVIQLAVEGIPRLSWQFFTSFPSSDPEMAGILSAWVGSFLVMLVTTAAAVPLGIAAGIYLEEYARKDWLSALIEINVTNLAGVPSIVYGLLALGFFNYILNLGESILTAGLTLGLLILPVVIVTTREALRAIPDSLREAAYALGASKWRTIWDHVLPYSAGSILTGIIIGLSRAIGETAPLVTIGALTFIAFLPPSPIQPEFPFFSLEWLKSPFTVMPIQMFNWVSRPEIEFQVNAAAAGVVLVFMTLTMNGLAIYLRYRFRKGIKW
ncbi:phosphate ABC transporter permease PstA [Leptothermofonsia sichuanensis E412]|uniref:phosphate ABC transporter permease PstA n=1 Tax=Leptothermofonsia sichuanensis TaxID=2917832 RepID=UPI001CA6B2E4|nr:phosphate ABC transporter permease PstA [Leptothermofonsia sichuanensis]QZZ21674.1 phosphate ABC transporter permease PstA [Leptothermofonsia sichuanensis E412]